MNRHKFISVILIVFMMVAFCSESINAGIASVQSYSEKLSTHCLEGTHGTC